MRSEPNIGPTRAAAVEYKKQMLAGALAYLKEKRIPLKSLAQLCDLAGVSERVMSSKPYAEIKAEAKAYQEDTGYKFTRELQEFKEKKLHAALDDVLGTNLREISFRRLCEIAGLPLTTDRRRYPSVVERMNKAFGYEPNRNRYLSKQLLENFGYKVSEGSYKKQTKAQKKAKEKARKKKNARAKLPQLRLVPEPVVTHQLPDDNGPETPMIRTMKQRIQKMTWEEYMEYRA